MLTEFQRRLLADKALELVSTVGVLIRHDGVTEIMKKKGCQVAADGRTRVPKELIDEFTAYQKKSQARDDEDQELLRRFGPDYAHHLIWTGQRESIREQAKDRLIMSAFDCGPTRYHDYLTGQARPVDGAVFEEMMKFTQATDEIGYGASWYRQDLPPKIERIHSLVHAMRFTDKFDGVEAIYPEVIKYLVEAGEIYYEKPGCSWFLAGSECFTPPLILDHRSAEDMLERARLGVGRYHICTMPTVGLNSPVTVSSSIVLCCAELLAGLAVAWALEPETDLSARIICNIVDMATANATAHAPEVQQVNIGTKEIFDDFWGGHAWTEVHFSASAKRPGLEAVIEYATGSARYAQLLGVTDSLYCGMGTLDNGAVGSPTQFMLDMEMRRMLHAATSEIDCSEDALAFDLLREGAESHGEFLTSEHTLLHHRDLFASKLFGSTFSGYQGAGHGSEKEILDKADAMWRENVARWEPPDAPEDKLRALDALVERAKKEFGFA